MEGVIDKIQNILDTKYTKQLYYQFFYKSGKIIGKGIVKQINIPPYNNSEFIITIIIDGIMSNLKVSPNGLYNISSGTSIGWTYQSEIKFNYEFEISSNIDRYINILYEKED